MDLYENLKKHEEHEQVEGESYETTLVVCFLFVACLLLAYLIQHFKLRLIHSSGASVLVGLIAGGTIHTFYSSTAEEQRLRFKDDFFFYVVLPPIIFHAGYTMRKRRFFKNIMPIIVLGVFGTLGSTLFIGLGLFGMEKFDGLAGLEGDTLNQSLVLGTVLSATDSVAFTSMLSSHSHTDFFSLVFGESIINDAATIVLYRAFTKTGGLSLSNLQYEMPKVLWFFVQIFSGSLGIGMFFGLASAFTFKHLDLKTMVGNEILLTGLFAYTSYLTAELTEMSGIVSLFFCGVVMAHYQWYQMSSEAQTTTLHGLHSAAYLAELFVYVVLGADTFLYSKFLRYPSLIVLSFVLSIVGRALCVFLILGCMNLFRRRLTCQSFKETFIVWFAGSSRGAIAYALALQINAEEIGEDSKNGIVASVHMIVLCTTLLWGTITSPVLEVLGFLDAPKGEEEPVGVDSTPRSGSLKHFGSGDSATPPSGDQVLPVEALGGVGVGEGEGSLEDGENGRPLPGDDDADRSAPYVLLGDTEVAVPHKSPSVFKRIFRHFDDRLMKPVFGGRIHAGIDGESEAQRLARRTFSPGVLDE